MDIAERAIFEGNIPLAYKKPPPILTALMSVTNVLTTLTVAELRRFITGTRSSVKPEKTATLLRSRVLETDHLDQRILLLEPLIVNLRNRLRERNILDAQKPKAWATLPQKDHERLKSLAILLTHTASARILLNPLSEEAEQNLIEADMTAEGLREYGLQAEIKVVRAVKALQSAQREKAEQFLETANTVAQRENVPEAVAYARKYLAQIRAEEGNYEQAIELLSTAIGIFPAQSAQFAGREYILYVDLARVLAAASRIEEAYRALHQAWELVRERPELRMRILVLNGLTDWYTQADMLPQALEQAQQALPLARTADVPTLIASALVRVGSILLKLGNTLFARNHFQESADIFKEHGFIVQYRRALMHIADTFAVEGEYNQALKLYREILDSAPDVDLNIEGLVFLHHVIGDMLTKLERYDEAASEYETGLKLSTEIGIVRGSLRMLRSLGHLHRLQSKNSEAVACYQQALQLFEGDDEGTARSHRALSELYEATGDLTCALRHLREYQRITGTLHEQLRDTRLNAMQVQHRVEWYRREAEAEKERRELTEAELQLHTLLLTEREELLGAVRKEAAEAIRAIEEGRAEYAIPPLKAIVRRAKKEPELNTEPLRHLYSTDRIFQQTLRTNHPHLTKGQLRLAALIRAGLDNNEIAGVLKINGETLSKQRYRIRKTLGLSKGEDLEKYLREIGQG